MALSRAYFQEQAKQALRAQDKVRVKVLRLISAEAQRAELEARVELDESAMIVLLEKMRKQRRDSIAQFTKAGRDDLVASEQSELDIIGEFLPEPLSEQQIEDLINTAVADLEAGSMKDMGKVMAQIKPQLTGRADMSQVSAAVKRRLSS